MNDKLKLCRTLIDELDLRWRAVQKGEDALIPHDVVVRWLETWGTPDFKSWKQHYHGREKR